jgi:ribosome maturation factor RimP
VKLPGFTSRVFCCFTTFWKSRDPGEAIAESMSRDVAEKLWPLIEPILEPDGLELVELEFKLELGRWILRIYIDKPGGVTLEDCEAASRQVSAFLDATDPIRRSYHLEVSSPGINRVLRREKDFEMYAGNRICLRTRTKLDGRRNFSGILKGAKDAKILLDLDGRLIEIALSELERARLDVPESDLFARKPQQPIGAAGE